jgi:two-component system response regulator HupR/HoxA
MKGQTIPCPIIPSEIKLLPCILIVDDEIRSLKAIECIIKGEFDVKTVSGVKAAERILKTDWAHIILCDQCMRETSGVAFLKSVRERWPNVIRMIVSGYTDGEDVIASVTEAGVYQYITKPWRLENLTLTLRNAARQFELQRRNELLAIKLSKSVERGEPMVMKRSQEPSDHHLAGDGIIRSEQSPINEACDRLRLVAPYDISVLLTGESGTGKELAARALHRNSLRWGKPFVVENCGALSDELLESELFGHKRGAFTGAVEDHVGLFERADGGTVFLDEIGDISPAFQVKLLRVLQEGEIRPVGASHMRHVDVRIIAATNRNIDDEVRAGRFREDLYYRLAAVTIWLPPLRERPGDIAVLAQVLVEKAMKTLNKRVAGFSKEALDCLSAYHWPGNVRELQNEVQRMLVMCREGAELGADLISSRIVSAVSPEDVGQLEALTSLEGSLKERVELLEARILKETLIRHRWNKSRAARELGLSRVGLRSKLERYELDMRAPPPEGGSSAS